MNNLDLDLKGRYVVLLRGDVHSTHQRVVDALGARDHMLVEGCHYAKDVVVIDEETGEVLRGGEDGTVLSGRRIEVAFGDAGAR